MALMPVMGGLANFPLLKEAAMPKRILLAAGAVLAAAGQAMAFAPIAPALRRTASARVVTGARTFHMVSSCEPGS